MLWRALSHVGKGFYIDVGAQDPLVDSVSLAFYEHGWRGIHVEPTPFYAEALRQARPEDIVIQAAVGAGPAVLPFFEIPGTGISTADPAIAEQHRQRGFDIREIAVSCIPLSAILNTRADQDVHWLKIDVEGLERQVLSSWGTCPVRPWIVVVESTLPLTQIETHGNWEALILGYGYTPVYFDGLNRYYVSDAYPELKNAFAAPPNVFDSFRLNGTASATFHKLIEERFDSRTREAQAQFAQRESAINLEIERLTLKLASQDKEIGEREQAVSQQWSTAQQRLHRLERDWALRERMLVDQAAKTTRELEDLLRAMVRREQEVGAQLLSTQQRADQNGAERERLLVEQLQSVQQDLLRVEQERTRREQEVSTQLLSIQQRANQESVDQAQIYSQRMHTLRQEHIEREQYFVEQLQSVRQDLLKSEQERTRREQEIGAQLLTFQQRANKETADNARLHSEQADALRQEHAQRELLLTRQLHTIQLECRQLEQEAREKASTLERELDQLREDYEKSTTHSTELSAKVATQNQLVESYAACEAELRSQLLDEKVRAQDLAAAVARMNDEIRSIHASRVWRLTSFLKSALSFESHTQVATPIATPAPASTLHATPDNSDSAFTVSDVSDLSDLNQKTMLENVNPSPASNQTRTPGNVYRLHELLGPDDSAFVINAYRVLLRRDPDPSGFAHFLERVRRGDPKTHVIRDIRFSEEGRINAVRVQKLSAVLWQQRLSSLPLIGLLASFLPSVDDNRPSSRRLRRMENRLARLFDSHAQTSAEVNRKLDALEMSLQSLGKQIANTTLRIAKGERTSEPTESTESSVEVVALPVTESVLDAPIVFSGSDSASVVEELASIVKNSTEAHALAL